MHSLIVETKIHDFTMKVAVVVHDDDDVLHQMYSYYCISTLSSEIVIIVPIGGTRLLNKDVDILDSVGDPQGLP